MVVISDTDPLNYLLLIGHVGILPKMYAEILIPVEVRNELLHPNAPDTVREWIQQPPAWLTVMESGQSLLDLHKNTDAGERSAITLAHRLGAELLLADDALAATEANRYGLRVIGTLGLLRQAHQEGLLNIHEALEKLKRTSFRRTEKLLETVLQGL